jgi:hypothetical protein
LKGFSVPIQINVNLTDLQNGAEVSSTHFGLNFVADYERIGDLGWQTYDDVVAGIDAHNLRYPGGITAEIGFDIKDPNASILTLEDGSQQMTMGAFDFAAYAAEQGLSSSFIVPTAQLLKLDPSSGTLVYDESLDQFVYDFIMGIMVASGGKVSLFEIGNEYESHMTSQEYGALVNILAPKIDAIIEEYGYSGASPEIAMQVWTLPGNEASSLTMEDLSNRADGVWSQLNEEAISSIDALVTHWYLKDYDLTYKEVYEGIQSGIQDSMSIVDEQLELFDEKTQLIVSEWNVNHKEDQLFGMAQVPMIILMMSELIQAGVDQLDFWSAQYHTTSLALNNGDLTAAGTAMSYLEEATLGMTVADVEIDDTNLGGVLFSSGTDAVLALSNLTAGQHTFDYDLEALGSQYATISIGYLSVYTDDADGEFNGYTGLPEYLEPDLEGFILWKDITLSFDEIASIELDAYQTVFIEFEIESLILGKAGDDVFLVSDEAEAGFAFGGSGNDTIIFSDGANNIKGGKGVDEINFSNSLSGVSVWFDQGVVETSSYFNDTDFTAIEKVIGTSYDDRFTIYDGNADVSLAEGEDNVFIGANASGNYMTGEGDDFIRTESGTGYIHAGKGDDYIHASAGGKIQGGRGDDTIFAWGQGDQIIFNLTDGNDTIYGFDTQEDDMLFSYGALEKIAEGEFTLYSTYDGTMLNFNSGGSIEYVNLSANQVNAYLDELN